ncbi:uncharacterized protein LOC143239478 [Tachypleus tridentatus]|uniref:uncharacterized protein LOC143239478 n=1 Tax=Tachypleus tridentatus TaxID=6853 RepID=UPI003FD12E5F
MSDLFNSDNIVRSDVNSRPSSAELVELHIYQVPCDRWIERQKLAKGKVVHYATSSGFIRVSPTLTLSDLRKVFPNQLDGETLPRHFIFLRRVGRNFTQVKKHQENELKVKSYLPPFASDPEIYIKECQNTRNSPWLQEEDSGVDELIDIQGQRSQDGSTSPTSPYNLSSGLPSPLTHNFTSSGGKNGVMKDETISRRRSESAEIRKKERGAVFQGFSRRSKISNCLYESGSESQQISGSIKGPADLTLSFMEAENGEKQQQVDYFVKKFEDGKLFISTQEVTGRTTPFIKDDIDEHCYEENSWNEDTPENLGNDIQEYFDEEARSNMVDVEIQRNNTEIHCDVETRSIVPTTVLENDAEKYCNKEAVSNEAISVFTWRNKEKHCHKGAIYNGATKLIMGTDVRKYCCGEVGSKKSEEYPISDIFSKLPKRKVAELTGKETSRISVNKIKSCSNSRLPVFIGQLKRPLSRSAGQEKGRYNIRPSKVFPKRTTFYSNKCQDRPTSNHSTHICDQHRPISAGSIGTGRFVENVNKLTKASKLPRLVQNVKTFSSSGNVSEKIKHAKINRFKVPELTKREILTTTNRRINRLATKCRKNGIHNRKMKLINCSNYETIVDSTKNNERFMDQPDTISRENITRKKATFTVSREYKTQTETWKRFQQIWRQLVETGSFQKRPFLLKRDFTTTNQLVWDKNKNFLILRNVPVASNVSTFKIFPGVNLKKDYELTYTEGNRRPSNHTPLCVRDTLMKNGYDTPLLVTNENVKMNTEPSYSVIMRNEAVLSSTDVGKKERNEQNGSMFKPDANVRRNYITQHEVDSVRRVRSKQRSVSGIHISNQTNQSNISTTNCAEKYRLCREVTDDISMNTTEQSTRELEYPRDIIESSIITSKNSGGGMEQCETVDDVIQSKRSKQKFFRESEKGLENKNFVEVRNKFNTVEQVDKQAVTQGVADVSNKKENQRDETKLKTNFNVRRKIKRNEFLQNYIQKNKDERIEQKYASKDKSDGATHNMSYKKFSFKMSTKTDIAMENKECLMDTNSNRSSKNYEKWKQTRENRDMDAMSENRKMENCYLNIKSPNDTLAGESVAENCNHFGSDLNITTIFTNNDISSIQEKESKEVDESESESNFTAKNKGNESSQHLTAGSSEGRENRPNPVLSETIGFDTHRDSLIESGVEVSARRPDLTTENLNGRTIRNCDETSKRLVESVLGEQRNSSAVTIIYDSYKPEFLRNYHVMFRDVYKSPYEVANKTRQKDDKTNIQNNYETGGQKTTDSSLKQVKDVNPKRPVNFQLRRSRSDSDSLATGRLRQVKTEVTKSCYKYLRKDAMSSLDLAEDKDTPSRVTKLQLILDHIRSECRMLELKRENMLGRVKQLQLKAFEKSDQVKNMWKKNYAEERKKSTPLEHECTKYRDLLQNLHRELLANMEFGFGNNSFAGKAGLPSSRLSAKFSIARLLQEIEDLKQRVESTKFRLTAETKLKCLVEKDVKTLRQELVKKKIQITLIRNQEQSATNNSERDSYISVV